MKPRKSTPRRKRLKHVKRHSNEPKPKPENSEAESQICNEGAVVFEISEAADWSNNPIICRNFHDYSLPPGGNVQESSPLPIGTTEDVMEESQEVPLDLLIEVKDKLALFMNHRWVPIVHRDAVHVVQISAQDNIAVQRSIILSPDGAVKLFVHCKEVDTDPFVKFVVPPIPLDSDSVGYFVDRAVEIVNNVKSKEICGGYDEGKFKIAWGLCPFGEIDKNPYQECRYVETFRSVNCLRLVKGTRWRCAECTKLARPLRRRANLVTSEQPCTFVNNKCLSEEQKLKKLQDKRKEVQARDKKIVRLQSRMQTLLKKQGVTIDLSLSDELGEVLNDAKVTPGQSIFLQQQIKASQKKNMTGMRWHPTMIRLALSIHLTSPAAYELLRDTGMVKLPSSRTLFDYSHVKPIQEGIDQVVLDSIEERVLKLKEAYQKFHVLMADEMHISQNLIFQKSSKRLVGYTSMDDFDKEVRLLEKFLESPDKEVEQVVASKVLTYMIKGVSSGIKGVVATFAVSNFSPDQMYLWTWQVIGALERSKVAIIAFVSDGCTINRAFIKKHTPLTTLYSGVVFDTKHKGTSKRPLYFMADVPHLLKTIRNNLLNSRSDKKPSRRHMVFKGKKITWDYIIRLYESKKGKLFRKSYKLNAMNVYPDSYARMKVKYAAQVLSKTVAQDLEDQKWEGASETINFIRLVNDWFDCLNGAHSSVAQKQRNKNLESYTSKDDPRFDYLFSFLDYIYRWKEDASQSYNVSINNSAATDTTSNDIVHDNTIDPAEEGRDDEEENTPAKLRILAQQTIEGIEMTTYAFVDAVKFLLKEGTKFVNARVFCQDPLEQHFSKVRAGQGGSTNPNLGQVLKRNRGLHCVGQLGMKRRRGNTEVGNSHVEVTTEPLPKRKIERKVKFLEMLHDESVNNISCV